MSIDPTPAGVYAFHMAWVISLAAVALIWFTLECAKHYRTYRLARAIARVRSAESERRVITVVCSKKNCQVSCFLCARTYARQPIAA